MNFNMKKMWTAGNRNLSEHTIVALVINPKKFQDFNGISTQGAIV